ncbi:unnamed protein product (macronuclear) [Paramecium tetraurelia]|uniref:Uncharacterized protein n=1 Tax=Paramecium tetraurelia TaxID=5888 RepID=A0DHC1_PARTE|nr:uncharacterized protein GSPATT00016825001 [Paramecium tetraurelia]CAK82438.1 unnamed protein product [Paramecium tetraurelia]|eukprot:XP_001449835.1 hypothetical protein (macronuclear) [Paramecium tetraurelia strain d4-2]
MITFTLESIQFSMYDSSQQGAKFIHYRNLMELQNYHFHSNRFKAKQSQTKSECRYQNDILFC